VRYVAGARPLWHLVVPSYSVCNSDVNPMKLLTESTIGREHCSQKHSSICSHTLSDRVSKRGRPLSKRGRPLSKRGRPLSKRGRSQEKGRADLFHGRCMAGQIYSIAQGWRSLSLLYRILTQRLPEISDTMITHTRARARMIHHT
jgi:hypothetical protein